MKTGFVKVFAYSSIALVGVNSYVHGSLNFDYPSDDHRESGQNLPEGFGIAAVNSLASGSTGAAMDLTPLNIVEKKYFDHGVHFVTFTDHKELISRG